MLTDTSEIKRNNVRQGAEPEYFDWAPQDSPLAIHMNLEAVDGIARDVIEVLELGPRRDTEVGGLLLGRVTGGNTVWIEQYQRISCEHSFGPHFILADQDTAALEDAATNIFETREVAVVGLYRSHTRPGLQLEESDFELIRRYFSDPSDLVLLVKPGKGNNLFAQFHRYDPGGGAQPVGERFPFRGRVMTPDTRLVTPDTARTIGTPPKEEAQPDEREKTRPQETAVKTKAENAVTEPPQRRLVPDFPIPPEPAPSVFGLSDTPGSDHWRRTLEPLEPPAPKFSRKWLPLAGAVVLVGGAFWFFSQGKPGLNTASTPAASGEAPRPLGLYVDPQGDSWHILWNPNATALQNARSVQLFVREGDDQNRIDLAPRNLATGAYDYHPTGNDVTFRLEVADQKGLVSAESFRLMRSADLGSLTPANPSRIDAKPPIAPAGPAIPPPKQEEAKAPPLPAPAERPHIVQPRPTYRAPPVVAAGIRPRINGTVPIDVHVQIDEHGRVTSATPVTKLHGGLDEYLAARAVQAAKQWRFEPAKADGKPIAGAQTIHFVFTK
jgi:hypothetical protein